MAVSQTTIGVLREAGWYPDREFDTTAYQEFLTARGFQWHDAARQFLQSYGGLYLAQRGNGRRFHFNAKRAGRSIPARMVEQSMEQLQASLAVIGTTFDEHMVLLMAEDGRIWGIYDDEIALFGTTAEESLDRLCCGKDPIRQF
jgi:hypothetical protein